MSMTLLASNVLGSSAASVTFSSIDQSYKTLRLVVSARTDGATNTATLIIAPNASSTSLTFRNLTGSGSAAASSSGSTGQIGDVVAASSTASTFGSAEILLPNYAGSSNKAMSADVVTENNATAAQQDLYANLWSNTAAITSLVLSPGAGNFVTNSSFYLYGLK